MLHKVRVPLLPMLSKKMLKIATFSHSPCKIKACKLTMCEISMCKHIYKPNINTRFLLLPSIVILIAEIFRREEEREEKSRREVEEREGGKVNERVVP
jgi:hypothetical protein